MATRSTRTVKKTDALPATQTSPAEKPRLPLSTSQTSSASERPPASTPVAPNPPSSPTIPVTTTDTPFLPDPDPDSDSDSDDEDTVEHEIPVYLSHALGKNLHLFQFPVTDNVEVPERAAEKGWKISARWKPNAKRFEMEIPLDTRQEVYDRERGEELGEGARLLFEKELAVAAARANAGSSLSGSKKKKKEDREREAMASREGPKKSLQHIKLRSQLVPDQTSYMAGCMKDGALYLHPITHQFQLRPALDYLDALDEQAKEERRKERAMDDSDSEDEKKEQAGKAVAVVVKRVTEDGKAVGSGYGGGNIFHAMREEEEEPWTKLGWMGNQTEQAQLVLDKLFDVPAEELECISQPLDMLKVDPRLTAVSGWN
ncbi:RNA Polymerase C (III) 37 kDa subunit [Phaffia rhodozyma]|uniref:RNA Polymerase C (III) 37 kDa subunit n=1 Tax=Phaffia rhodozyma TaxID=264483 RepID=A0A0F7SWT1_PHARH|nr:RNA Polymerase C (III) 37 kDa subunit [Phaffia rhodozyma]